MYDQDEPFSNPIAPADHSSNQQKDAVQKQNLSNEDFRKLMMTPSTNRHADSSLAFGSKAAASVRGNRRQIIVNDEFKKPQSTVSADKRKKKYKQQKKDDKDEEEDKDSLTEILKNYRDRAKERRETKEDEDDQINSMGNYNSVANMTSEDAAERRRQLIEESKYLGGDMEHTHLVKGLDYALLQKVRSEIEFKKDQETLELVENELSKVDNLDESDEEEEEDWTIKSKLAQNLMKVLFENNLPEKNDYFLPGRLAYVFDLENDCPSDAFTSLLRSKADCPNWEQLNTLSTNDIVLNKLIDIFQELREEGGRRTKKKTVKQTDRSNDSNKFSFINSACDGGKSESASSRGDDQKNKKRSDVIETADLNSIYDQELNVESIRKSRTKVENDLDIYDDLDDYVMPHKSETELDRRSRRSYSREDDYRYSSSKYSSSNRDRNYDKKRKRRSSSRERHSRNYSSEEERDNYHSYKERRKDYERTRHRSRTPDKYRYHSSSNYSSSSRRERY